MLEEVTRLSVPERIRLVEEIWDSIAAEEAEVPVTEAQREQLQRRAECYRNGANPGGSCGELKAQL